MLWQIFSHYTSKYRDFRCRAHHRHELREANIWTVVYCNWFLNWKLLQSLQYQYSLCHPTHIALHLCGVQCTTNGAIRCLSVDYNLEGSKLMTSKWIQCTPWYTKYWLSYARMYVSYIEVHLGQTAIREQRSRNKGLGHSSNIKHLWEI